MWRARSSHPVLVEGGRDAAAVKLQCALLADGVGALANPVLPRRQLAEDFRFHRLWTGEPQVRFHAGHRVWREARSLLEHHAQLIVPVEILVSRGDEAKLGRLLAL